MLYRGAFRDLDTQCAEAKDGGDLDRFWPETDSPMRSPHVRYQGMNRLCWDVAGGPSTRAKRISGL
jgi:hypothetical protein